MRKNKIIIIISIINIISAFTIGIFSGCNIGNDDNEITINGITYSFFSYNDENYYYAHNVEDESIVSVKIKDYINGYPVKKISSFRNCTNLTNIIIPSTVTTLADSAFYGCSALENIELPD